MNTLILVDNNKNSLLPSNSPLAYIFEIYNSNHILARVLRKLILKYHIPLEYLIFNDWKALNENIELVILFDTGNAKYILPKIKKKFKDAKVVLWFWNSVERTINPKEIDKSICELWSFDPIDCIKYDMRYNVQFFCEENREHIDEVFCEKMIKTDIFFAGTDKGRLPSLIMLRKIFEHYGISYDFYIVGQTNKFIVGLDQYYKKPLNYNEIMSRYATSKCIVDIVSDGQRGLTLRPIEALFLKKKLITNFKDIRNYDFYNSNNIFILGEDATQNVNEFIKTPYDDSRNYIYEEKYCFTCWLKNFGEYEAE